jgi:hypothetical protein
MMNGGDRRMQHHTDVCAAIVSCHDIELRSDPMSHFNMAAVSTYNGEPDITQCLTEVQTDTCYVS